MMYRRLQRNLLKVSMKQKIPRGSLHSRKCSLRINSGTQVEMRLSGQFCKCGHLANLKQVISTLDLSEEGTLLTLSVCITSLEPYQVDGVLEDIRLVMGAMNKICQNMDQ